MDVDVGGTVLSAVWSSGFWRVLCLAFGPSAFGCHRTAAHHPGLLAPARACLRGGLATRQSTTCFCGRWPWQEPSPSFPNHPPLGGGCREESKGPSHSAGMDPSRPAAMRDFVAQAERPGSGAHAARSPAASNSTGFGQPRGQGGGCMPTCAWHWRLASVSSHPHSTIGRGGPRPSGPCDSLCNSPLGSDTSALAFGPPPDRNCCFVSAERQGRGRWSSLPRPISLSKARRFPKHLVLALEGPLGLRCLGGL